MSIINDALKKTQDNLKNEKEGEKTSPPTEGISTPAQQNAFLKENLQHIAAAKLQNAASENLGQKTVFDPGQDNSVKLSRATSRQPSSQKSIVIAGLFLILSISAAVYSFDSQREQLKKVFPSLAKNLSRKSSPRTSPPKNVSTANINLQKVLPLLPQSSQETANTFTLNGIATVDDRQMALINNEIYEEGDRVDGKEIISISLDKVEIKDNDKIIILNVKNKNF
ncbi:MAG: hypothetical protein WC552_00280 [Candidatus Omnitrophota bacterium]